MEKDKVQSRVQKHVAMLRNVAMLIELAKANDSKKPMLKGEDVMLQYLTYNQHKIDFLNDKKHLKQFFKKV